MKSFAILIFVLIGTQNALSQSNIVMLDDIQVEVTTNNEILYIHKIKQSETLYSLARFFKIPLQDLMLINDISEGQTIALGSEIKIPINPENIITNKVIAPEGLIPLIYKVKRKETLYRIAKGYFNQNIQQLMGRNKLTKLSIGLGQKLTIGWWSPQQILNSNSISQKDAPNYKVINISETISENNLLADSLIVSNESQDSLIVTNVEIPVIKNLKGIAIWERSDPNDDFLFVMHKFAKVNSIIKLQHPVTKNVVVAKVVDKLPKGIYTDDVDLIISKAVALQLGALETRFQVGMTYYE